MYWVEDFHYQGAISKNLRKEKEIFKVKFPNNGFFSKSAEDLDVVAQIERRDSKKWSKMPGEEVEKLSGSLNAFASTFGIEQDYKVRYFLKISSKH